MSSKSNSSSTASSSPTWTARVLDVVPHTHEIALALPHSAPTEIKAWPKAPAADELETRHRNLDSLGFDMFAQLPTDDALLLALEVMFETADVLQTLSVSRETLRCFLLAVRALYRRVPFHNFQHAFNVTQAAYSFLFECQVRERLSLLERAVLLIACLCHDLDHPGLANSFQVAAATELAIRYNDRSVLENHHCQMMFRVLAQPSSNLLANLDQSTRRRVRALLIDCVLATDLASHKSYMERFAALPADAASDDASEHRGLLLCCLIKCADLANEVRPAHALSQRWAALVMTEFFAQGDLEKSHGFEVGPLNDRDKSKTAAGQIGFINFLAAPLYAQSSRLFPKMQFAADNMSANRERWEAMKATEEK